MGVRITENFIRETEALRKCLLYKDVTWEITKKDDYNDWGTRLIRRTVLIFISKRLIRRNQIALTCRTALEKRDKISSGWRLETLN